MRLQGHRWAPTGMGASAFLSSPCVASQSALRDPKLPGPRGRLQGWALLPVGHLGSGLHHVSGTPGAPGLGGEQEGPGRPGMGRREPPQAGKDRCKYVGEGKAGVA